MSVLVVVTGLLVSSKVIIGSDIEFEHRVECSRLANHKIRQDPLGPLIELCHIDVIPRG